MKIAGLWSGHDCSFCVLENGVPVVHAELERYIREKEPKGDAAKLLLDVLGDAGDIQELASCYPRFLLENTATNLLGGRNVTWVGHHQAHAAHAFYSSNHKEALVLTIDGGGVENDDGIESATTLWRGVDRTLVPITLWPSRQINIGGLWTRVTRYVFRLQNGWPRGHQAGSVMAMAALGDPNRFYDSFMRMMSTDIMPASMKPAGQPVGAYTGNDPRHPYLGRFTDLADGDEQTKYDLAAGLQAATEEMIRMLVGYALTKSPGTNKLCIAGGVALNSVAMGKIQEWFPEIEDVFIPPVPYDGGLSIGAAQFAYHCIENQPRVNWDGNMSPYLGEEYSETDIRQELDAFTCSEASKRITVRHADESEIVDYLTQGKIIAIFGGQSESGRRALGNRSIVADPRNPNMKELINQKVKHRQWYRPFAPSIMREHVKEWFGRDFESPYMSHVIKFKPDMAEKVPAVTHFDNSARLQTVEETDNPVYYSLLAAFYEKTGVPILLNTSFNDREPICETVTHAVNCYLGTDIDFMWISDLEILVTRE